MHLPDVSLTQHARCRGLGQTRSLSQSGSDTLTVAVWVRHAHCRSLGQTRSLSQSGSNTLTVAVWVRLPHCHNLGQARSLSQSGSDTLTAAVWVRHAHCRCLGQTRSLPLSGSDMTLGRSGALHFYHGRRNSKADPDRRRTLSRKKSQFSIFRLGDFTNYIFLQRCIFVELQF